MALNFLSPDAVALTLALPQRFDGLLTDLEEGKVAVANPQLERQLTRLNRAVRATASAVVFGALLTAGAVLRASDPVLGNLLMIASVLPLLNGIWLGRRR